MYKNLAEYLQGKQDEEDARNRKLKQLKRTVRNGDGVEIIAALIDSGAAGIDFKHTTFDYLYEYFASAQLIDVLVVMLFLNMKHPLTEGAIIKAYARQQDTEESRSTYIDLLVATMEKRL